MDGLIVWDYLCGTVARPCPKLDRRQGRQTTIGQYLLPPPCIYLLPRTIPTVRNKPWPDSHALREVSFLAALHQCFGGDDDELNYVRFQVAHRGSDTVRTTTVERGDVMRQESRATPIRRR